MSEMVQILEQKRDFYNSLLTDKCDVLVRLKANNISILSGFIERYDMVAQFYQTYYSETNNPRIVLCGINPGKLGAGKTGVPFLDFRSISKMLHDVNESDQERSAQFIYALIESLGQKYFFDDVYFTNISWFGFKDRANNNFNYYRLDKDIQNEFTNGFLEEMEIVKPKVIIPLSQQVKITLDEMKQNNRLKIKVSEPLWHPNYASFPSKWDHGQEIYKTLIEEHIKN